MKNMNLNIKNLKPFFMIGIIVIIMFLVYKLYKKSNLVNEQFIQGAEFKEYDETNGNINNPWNGWNKTKNEKLDLKFLGSDPSSVTPKNSSKFIEKIGTTLKDFREENNKNFLMNNEEGPGFSEDEYRNFVNPNPNPTTTNPTTTNPTTTNPNNYFKKPNIIFYYDDDQDLMDYNYPIGENEHVDTSQVTKIWEEGMSFTNAYTPMAICAPSRSCLYTGLYPLKNGCFANHLHTTRISRAEIIDFEKQTTTSTSSAPKENGNITDRLGTDYDIWLLGKSHVGPQILFNWDKTIECKKSFINICEFKKALNARINGIKKGEIEDKPLCIFVASELPHSPLKKEIFTNIKKNDCTLNADEQDPSTTKKDAFTRIKGCESDNEKFCHKEYNTYLKKPEDGLGDLCEKSLFYPDICCESNKINMNQDQELMKGENPMFNSMSPREMSIVHLNQAYTPQFGDSTYYKNIKLANDQLEAFREVIEEYIDFFYPAKKDGKLSLGTIFMYSSDHGISEKNTVKESGVRVPLVVSWKMNNTENPATEQKQLKKLIKPKTFCDSLVSYVDILPTFLDINQTLNTQNPGFTELDGKSFLPLLRGEKKYINEYLYFVNTYQNTQKTNIFPSRSIRNYRFKYVRNFNAYEKLENNLFYPKQTTPDLSSNEDKELISLLQIYKKSSHFGEDGKSIILPYLDLHLKLADKLRDGYVSTDTTNENCKIYGQCCGRPPPPHCNSGKKDDSTTQASTNQASTTQASTTQASTYLDKFDKVDTPGNIKFGLKSDQGGFFIGSYSEDKESCAKRCNDMENCKFFSFGDEERKKRDANNALGRKCFLANEIFDKDNSAHFRERKGELFKKKDPVDLTTTTEAGTTAAAKETTTAGITTTAGTKKDPLSIVNKFIWFSAFKKRDIPYEELYDLHRDPFCKNNLLNDVVSNKVSKDAKDFIKKHKQTLSEELEEWMKKQKDFIPCNNQYYKDNPDRFPAGPMPLINPSATGSLTSLDGNICYDIKKYNVSPKKKNELKNIKIALIKKLYTKIKNTNKYFKDSIDNYNTNNKKEVVKYIIQYLRNTEPNLCFTTDHPEYNKYSNQYQKKPTDWMTFIIANNLQNKLKQQYLNEENNKYIIKKENTDEIKSYPIFHYISKEIIEKGESGKKTNNESLKTSDTGNNFYKFFKDWKKNESIDIMKFDKTKKNKIMIEPFKENELYDLENDKFFDTQEKIIKFKQLLQDIQDGTFKFNLDELDLDSALQQYIN